MPGKPGVHARALHFDLADNRKPAGVCPVLPDAQPTYKRLPKLLGETCAEGVPASSLEGIGTPEKEWRRNLGRWNTAL